MSIATEVQLEQRLQEAIVTYYDSWGCVAGYAVATEHLLGGDWHRRWICFDLFQSARAWIINQLETGSSLTADNTIII